jgi:predicted transcriptional regulator of viral defense system
MEGTFLTELERQEIPVFSVRKHRHLVDTLGDQELYEVLRGLTAKGWLLHVERGTYVVVPRAAARSWHEHPFVIAATLSPSPYYISYWSALSFHNLTQQMPRKVVTVVRDGRKAPVEFQGTSYQFVTRPARTFFGIGRYELAALNGAAHVDVSIADPEKTVLDCLTNTRFAGGISEVVTSIREGITTQTLSVPRLVDYAIQYPNKAVAHRLGFILSHAGHTGAVLDPLRTAVRRTGYPPSLDNGSARVATYHDQEWNIKVNVSDHLFVDHS